MAWMVIDNANNPPEVKVYNQNRELQQMVSMPEQIIGYEYEILETIECIRRDEKECPSMRREIILEVRRMMDKFRKEGAAAILMM